MKHKWPPAGQETREEEATYRPCQRHGCTIVRVTRHVRGENPWVEYERDGLVISRGKTPACEGEKT